LRRLSHDIAELSDLGLAHVRTPDSAVLELATADGRAVLTFDRRDFATLHRASPAHAGIVACTYDPDFVRLAKRIDATLATIDDLRGQLIRVARSGPA